MKLKHRRANLAVSLAAILAIASLAAISAILFVNRASTAGSSHYLAQLKCSNPCTIIITSLGIDDGKTVILSKGTSVDWLNKDSISHDLVGIGNWSSFSTGIISPGATSKPIILTTDGTYEYYCETTLLQGEVQVVG